MRSKRLTKNSRFNVQLWKSINWKSYQIFVIETLAFYSPICLRSLFSISEVHYSVLYYYYSNNFYLVLITDLDTKITKLIEL